MSSHNKISLNVVVNGAETPVEANVNAPLLTVAEHALNKSGNTGRDLSDWEFKDSNGALLDLSRKVGSCAFTDGTVLYLTLRVGVNG